MAPPVPQPLHSVPLPLALTAPSPNSLPPLQASQTLRPLPAAAPLPAPDYLEQPLILHISTKTSSPTKDAPGLASWVRGSPPTPSQAACVG